MTGLPFRPNSESTTHNESSWRGSVVRPRHNKTRQLLTFTLQNSSEVGK